MPVNVGDITEGKVTDIMNYGVFVKLPDGKSGLVHISEISKDYVEDIHNFLKIGDVVKVKVISIDDKGKIALSVRKAIIEEEKNSNYQNTETSKLDDMLAKFLKDSDERQLYLKKNMDSKRGYSRKH